MGDFDKAIADFTEVIRLDAKDAIAYMLVAMSTVRRPTTTTRSRTQARPSDSIRSA